MRRARYNINDDIREDIILRMEQLSNDAKLSKDMDEINKLSNLMITGKASEARDRCRQIIDGWIDEIRRI